MICMKRSKWGFDFSSLKHRTWRRLSTYRRFKYGTACPTPFLTSLLPDSQILSCFLIVPSSLCFSCLIPQLTTRNSILKWKNWWLRSAKMRMSVVLLIEDVQSPTLWPQVIIPGIGAAERWVHWARRNDGTYYGVYPWSITVYLGSDRHLWIEGALSGAIITGQEEFQHSSHLQCQISTWEKTRLPTYGTVPFLSHFQVYFLRNSIKCGLWSALWNIISYLKFSKCSTPPTYYFLGRY